MANLLTKDEFNKKLLAYVEAKKTKLLSGGLIINRQEMDYFTILWQVQFYRDYLASILPD